MTYAEKQVNWKIMMEGLFMENELSERRKNASESMGSVESPQALAGESCGAINGVNDRYSLPTAWRAGESQARLWVKSCRACSRLLGLSGGA
jgi:hypothetical protein